MGQITVEICAEYLFDALEAAAGGAERIELNSALALGGLTPSMAELLLVKRETPLKVIAMARPRGAGFCYGVSDFKQMFFDCQMMMGHGADGIAFGCLKADGTIDLSQTELMVKAIKDKGGEAVFHRAFDCVKDPFQAAEQLISLGVDRILTSGLKSKARWLETAKGTAGTVWGANRDTGRQRHPCGKCGRTGGKNGRPAAPQFL